MLAICGNDQHLVRLVFNHARQMFDQYADVSMQRFVRELREQYAEDLHADHRLLIIQYDESNTEIKLVNFGMPPVILLGPKGVLDLSSDPDARIQDPGLPFQIDVFPHAHLFGLLAGISQSALDACRDSLEHLMALEELDALEDSDLAGESFFWMNMLHHRPGHELHVECSGPRSLLEFQRLEEQFGTALEQSDASRVHQLNAGLVFHEILLNAFEHGMLGIAGAQKQQMLEEGTYDEELQRRARQSEGQIAIRAMQFRDTHIWVLIQDPGEGFDTRRYERNAGPQAPRPQLMHNRGIYIARDLSSSLVYSREGNAALFIMRLEADTDSADRVEATARQARPVDQATTPLGKLSLLYAEDDAVTRKLYTRLLERSVGTLYAAQDGREGLELFERYRPDMVVTDVQMPHLDGIDMACRIREIDSRVPVILTTAFSDREIFVRAIEAGINNFINKPIDIQRLRNILHEHAEIIDTRRQLETRLAAENRRKEMEFFNLQAERRYTLAQQRAAFAKEKLIIQNHADQFADLCVNLYYEPLEILSGDIYGLVRFGERQLLVYIIDSMGKGLGASVTAILSAAFINRLAQQHLSEVLELDFHAMLERYLEYIRAYLLDDELVSFTMALLDLEQNQLEYSSCGMYPAFVKDESTQSIQSLPANNPPYMIYSPPVSSRSIALPEDFSLLMYSDGLCESPGFGVDDVRGSFARHDGLKAVLDDFSRAEGLDINNIDKSIQFDDITVIRIARPADLR